MEKHLLLLSELLPDWLNLHYVHPSPTSSCSRLWTWLASPQVPSGILECWTGLQYLCYLKWNEFPGGYCIQDGEAKPGSQHQGPEQGISQKVGHIPKVCPPGSPGMQQEFRLEWGAEAVPCPSKARAVLQKQLLGEKRPSQLLLRCSGAE
ncbi:hypothetical protein P7K49_014647 [Saguinus oedipus]|uniref:Uncharacterized protein n=1 Tax=Saguinus oedipus TaxID=9490 RepID=A0ABQ9V6Z7_SAGOE|nr:hypothetical protein P7K49_014647 [Saguinus oedipus]